MLNQQNIQQKVNHSQFFVVFLFPIIKLSEDENE